MSPQSAFLWHVVPAAHDPVWPVPPQVPRPQSALEWHFTLVQVPLPHVPFPHWEFVVQLTCVQVIPAHVPPLQSELAAHSQAPPTQARPVPHVLFLVHAV